MFSAFFFLKKEFEFFFSNQLYVLFLDFFVFDFVLLFRLDIVVFVGLTCCLFCGSALFTSPFSLLLKILAEDKISYLDMLPTSSGPMVSVGPFLEAK